MTIDNWTFDFDRMMAVEWLSEDTSREWYLMTLDDVMYVGQPSSFTHRGGGWSWSYLSKVHKDGYYKDRDLSRMIFECYTSYLLEKAIGLEFADEA